MTPDPNKTPARITIITENSILVQVGSLKTVVRPHTLNGQLEEIIKAKVAAFRRQERERNELGSRMARLERELNA